MTYRQIFKDIYSRHKLFIRFYVAFALFASVFLFYANGETLISNAGTMSTRSLFILGGNFTVFLLIFTTNANISVTPPVALSISAILSIWGEYGTLPDRLQDFSFGLLDYWPVRIFVFVWAIISVLPRCTQLTHIGGLVIEDLDQGCGAAATILVTVSQMLPNLGTVGISHAATTSVTSSSTAVVQYGIALLNTLFCFALLIFMLVSFLLIRTFLFFVDILLMPVCTLIPLTSSCCEIIKVVSVVVMTLLAIFAPGIYIAWYCILLFCSAFFFKRAYISVRYFKCIYVRPLMKKIVGYDPAIPLVCPRAPKVLRQKAADLRLPLLLPVYAVQNSVLSPCIKRHERWWLAVLPDGCRLYKYNFFKKQILEIPLIQNETETIYLKESIRFFEIFRPMEEINIGKLFRKMKKKWHFVLSKEYKRRFNDILHLTGFADYNQFVKDRTKELEDARRNPTVTN